MRTRHLLAAALLAGAASGFKYHITHRTTNDEGEGLTQSAFVLSEGGMYATHAGPFGTNGKSEISLALTAAAAAGAAAPDLNIHVAFVDAETKAAAGVVRTLPDDSAVTLYCCNSELLAEGLCGPGVPLGGFIVHPDFAPRPVPVSTTVMTKGTAAGAAAYEVVSAGANYVIVAACDPTGAASALPDASIELDIAFQNPYGYLPGQVYGYLPFYGTLFVLYCLFSAVYAGVFIKQRAYLLGLQWFILGVVAFGTIEMAVWFFTYKSKNESGIPTPCNVCPVTSDYIAAVVINVAKRAVSRVLLLAVALGFGVVHPSLDRRTVMALAAMGVAYFAFGVLDDVTRETAYDSTGPSAWELPVLLLDLAFVMGIYGGLNKLRRDLAASGQLAKLKMYSRLLWVLVLNVLAWFIITMVLVLIRMRVVPVPWQSLFFLINFWDALYLLVLGAIAWIWAPGPESFNYAWYSQGVSNEADADAEDKTGGRSGARGGRAAGGIEMRDLEAAGGRYDDDALEDEDEEDDGLDYEDGAPGSFAIAGGKGGNGRYRDEEGGETGEEDDLDLDLGDEDTDAVAATAPKASASSARVSNPLKAAAPAAPDVTAEDVALDLEDEDDEAEGARLAVAAKPAKGGAKGGSAKKGGRR